MLSQQFEKYEMSNHMNNKTNQILLIDSSITLTKINDLKSHTKKIITFDLISHRLLTENGIEHDISENYISSKELELIDPSCLKFCQWYNQNHGNELLSYESVNLASLFRVEFNNFLIPFVKNFLILSNFSNNFQNHTFLSSNNLYHIMSNLSKNCEIIGKKEVKIELTWDTLQYDLTNSLSLKISKKNFQKLKSMSEKITSLISTNKTKTNDQKSFAFVEFDPIKYEKLFDKTSEFQENFFLYNRHRPISSNLKSLKIIKNSKIIPYSHSHTFSKILEEKIISSEKQIIKKFNKFLEYEKFDSFFQINNLSFWYILKPFLNHLFISKLKHSLYEIEISKKFLSQNKISAILLLSESGFTEQIMLSLARKFSIKSVLLQHGVILDNDNAYNYNKIIGGNLPELSNKFLVWGPSTFENITHSSFPKDKIMHSGSPNLDRILEQKKSIDEDPRTIVLLATGPRNQQCVGHDVNKWKSYESLIKKICLMAKTNHIQLIIKRHPDMAESNFSKNLLENFPNVKTIKHGNIIELLSKSKLVISIGVSSSIFEAQALGKPVLSLHVDYDVYGMPSGISKSIQVKHIEELESLLIDLLDNHEKYKNSVKTSSLDINNNFKNLGTSSFIILKNLIES